jgi:RimJ/RimL family protein N-acetyltransferase
MKAMRERNPLNLRYVRKIDCYWLWTLANHPVIRNTAYESDPIAWDDHQKWFNAKYNDPACTIYVAEKGQEAVGQIRFDLEENTAIVDLAVDPARHGRGYGTALIRKGTKRFIEKSKATHVFAYIKADNHASVRAFEKAGYTFDKELKVEGVASYRYVKLAERLS